MNATPPQPCECGMNIENLPANTSHCFIHHVNEPAPPESFIVCFECGHVYRTPQHLLEVFNREKPEECPPETDADKIFFCPECIHDF